MSYWNIYLLLLGIVCTLSSRAQNDTLKPVEVTANKYIRPADSYKAIPIKNIESNATESLADVLSKETPIYIKSYGTGGLSTISIRGAGASHTQIYWNGIAINSPTLGQLDLSTLPISFVDDAEIHLGASSIIDGSGGLGGAIQLNSSANYSTKLKASLVKELGSFGIDKTLLSLNLGNKKVQSKTSILRNLALNNFDYIDISQEGRPILERKNSELTQLGIKQEIYFKPKTNHEISFKGNYFNSYRQLPSIIGVQSKGEYQTDKTLRLLGEWNHFKKNSFHHLRLALIKDELNYIDTSAAINSLIKVDSYKSSYNFKHYFTDSIKLTFQTNFGTDIANSSGFDTIHTQNRQSIFLQFEHKLKIGLIYNVAFRHEAIDYVFTPIIPTLGLKYYIDKKQQLSVMGNIAKNYKAPSLNDLYWSPGGNLDLLPEVGFTSEVGFTFKSKKLTANITPYYSLIDNWIQWLPTSSGVWSPVNVKEVENKGLEISLEKNIQLKNKANISLQTGYNFVSSTNKSSALENDNSIGKQLIYVPQHTFNIVAKYNYKKLAIGYNQTVTGKVFIDATNTTYMPYYAPANLDISYKLDGKDKKNSFAVFGLKINNLYNEDYQIVANRPLPKRWFSIFLKINLSAGNE